MKILAPILEDVLKRNPNELEFHQAVKEVLESQEAYQKQARKWTEMSDYLYLKDNL